MSQERNSRYRNERELLKRKAEIEAKRKKALKKQLTVFMVFLIILGVALLDYGKDQTSLPHWLSVYGLSVSGMKPDAAAEKINTAFEATELIFEEGGAELYRTTLGEAGYSVDVSTMTNTLEVLQQELLASRGLIETKKNVEVEYRITGSETKLATVLAVENFETVSGRIQSSDAYLEYDNDTQTFVIVDSVQGDAIDEELLRTRLTDALEQSLAESLLSDAITVQIDEKVYQQVTITEDTTELVIECNSLNESLVTYEYSSIVYTFGSKLEILDADTICSWLVISDGGVEIDTDKAMEYISTLSSKYNTMYNARYFTTTGGEVVEMATNDYGYWIDEEGEYAQLLEDLKSGTQITREPVYSKTGYQRNGTDDLCGSYIEVSIEKQHLWLYKDYVLITETDIVSGLPTAERATLEGAFSIAYKASPYTLSSTEYGYETDVTYWMPFANGQGLHDATWQSSFGGTRYKTSAGSHGCVNLPLAQAAIIYNNIEAGYPILIY